MQMYTQTTGLSSPQAHFVPQATSTTRAPSRAQIIAGLFADVNRPESEKKAEKKAEKRRRGWWRTRIGALTKIYGGPFRYGGGGLYQFTDDDAGRDDLRILLDHYAYSNPLAIPRIIKARVPWLTESERESLMEQVGRSPQTGWNQGTAGTPCNSMTWNGAEDPPQQVAHLAATMPRWHSERFCFLATDLRVRSFGFSLEDNVSSEETFSISSIVGGFRPLHHRELRQPPRQPLSEARADRAVSRSP
jgi:hypothetical protein